MEELKWGDDNHKWIRPGHLFTCGPGSYKIPSVNDIPLNFKVSLLKVNILSSYSHFCGGGFPFWEKNQNLPLNIILNIKF